MNVPARGQRAGGRDARLTRPGRVWLQGSVAAVLLGGLTAAPALTWFGCLGVAVLVCCMLALPGFTGSSVTVTAPLTVVRTGEPVTLTVVVHAGRRPRRPALLTLAGTGFAPVNVDLGQQAPHGRLDTEITVTAGVRGVHEHWGCRWQTQHPLGLVRWSHRQLYATQSLVVAPAPAVLPTRIRGVVTDVTDGTGEPAGLRGYRPGDPARSVDRWASARRGAPIVREWEPEPHRGQVFLRLIALRCSPAYELAVAAVLTIGLEQLDAGHQVRTGSRPVDGPELLRWVATLPATATHPGAACTQHCRVITGADSGEGPAAARDPACREIAVTTGTHVDADCARISAAARQRRPAILHVTPDEVSWCPVG